MSETEMFDRQYELGSDSTPQADVPEGSVRRLVLPASTIYPGTARKAWLYLPARHEEKKALPLMIFMDGGDYVTRDGPWRVPVVLDNLIAQAQLPSMAAVFIDASPGTATVRAEAPNGSQYLDISNRSLEYDTINADYAMFILEEVFPRVSESIVITDHADGRALAGHSSGGLCAFNAAWHRPDQFSKVLCANGSFTNKRGGHIYMSLIGKSERKPIRIWQQTGAHDLVHPVWGVWSEANRAVAAALEAKSYDHKFIFGQGSHSPAHAAAVFPQAMRWLWRDYRAAASR